MISLLKWGSPNQGQELQVILDQLRHIVYNREVNWKAANLLFCPCCGRRRAKVETFEKRIKCEDCSCDDGRIYNNGDKKSQMWVPCINCDRGKERADNPE